MQVRGGGVTDEPALGLELLDDLGELLLEVGVRGREVTKARQHILALLPAVLAGEPAGRLVAEQHAEAQQQGGERLDREREDVHDLAGHVDVDRIVDPEGDHTTRHDEELVHARQQTTDGTRRVLAHVQRVDGRCGTDSETSDEPTDVHDRQVAARGSLHDHTEEDDEGQGDEAPLAAVLVSQRAGREGADEAAGLQGGDDVCGQVG